MTANALRNAPQRAAFTAPQKAALVIAALGPDAAKPIMEQVGDKHMRAFAEALAHLRDIPKEDLLAVVSEFVARLGARDGLMKGGFEEARNLIAHFQDEEHATKLLDDVDAPGGRTVWQKLEDVDPKAFAAWLDAQDPQAVTVVLSRLDADKASTTLGLLAPDMARTVLIRLTKPVNVRREALRVLEETIEREFLAPMRKKANLSDSSELVGSMLNNLPEEKRAAMLEILAKETPEILDSVKAYILTFKDIPARVPPNAVAKVVREVEVDVFLKAAKYGKQNAPEAVEYIFKNISQRMGQQYEEQIAALKGVTLAEAEAAQAEIMTAVRRLVAAGEFQLVKLEKPGAEAEEVYV